MWAGPAGPRPGHEEGPRTQTAGPAAQEGRSTLCLVLQSRPCGLFASLNPKFKCEDLFFLIYLFLL